MELFSFDVDYLQRLREGDPAIQAHFYSYFRDLLYAKLRRRLHSMHAIEEVRQEVFVRVLERLDDIRDPRKLSAYVNTVANHVLMEHYRSESRAHTIQPENIFGLVSLPIETPETEFTRVPTISISWDPRVIDADEYSELITALGDLVRGCGGAGIKRIATETLNLEYPLSAQSS